MSNSKMTKAESGRLGCLKRAENTRKRYDATPKKCKYCGNNIPYDDRFKKVFCNHSCSAKFNNSLRESKIKTRKSSYCKVCGTECKGKYCSRKCHIDDEYANNIKDWKTGKKKGVVGYSIANFIRKYLFNKYENKCCKCGWCEVNHKSKRIPLQINHIDGNHSNCSEDNLELLCPNCHSLTPNFGSLNRGKGREKRRDRYKEGKTY